MIRPLCCCVVVTLALASCASAQSLLDDGTKPTVAGGRVDASGATLRVSGAPGKPTLVTFSPANGVWDFSRRAAITLALRNPSDRPIVVRARAEMPDAGRLMDGSQNAIELAPGEARPFVVRLTRRPVDPTYAPFDRFYMYYKNLNVRDNTLDPSQIARLLVTVERWQANQSLVIESVDATGDDVPGNVPFLPFIDAYGQYVHGDWQGKIHGDADFAARVGEETRERATSPGPADRDAYGGWTRGPTRKASGFFRVEKVDGKWWFVDPLGHLFWSYGPTGVGFGGDVTPVTDRADWFVSLPDEKSFAPFYRNGHGAQFRYFQDKDWRGLDIQRVNLFRKYGEDYEAKVAQVSHDRLHSWGFNTIGNWSSPQVYGMHKTPYVVPINSPGVSSMRASDGHSMQDVYDPAWEPGLRAAMERERGRSAGDPWCIGYFVDNERSIGWRPRAAQLGELALKAKSDQPAKAKFIERLRAKYATIDALNKAWRATYASWDALRDGHDAPDFKDNDALLADCGDFGITFCERYFSVCRDAVKAVAPDQLFLGTRFYGHTDPAVVALAGKYCDVISYNIYDNPPTGRVNQYNKLDLPILSSEWGVESDVLQTPFRDEKLTATTPAERSAKIVAYVEAALRQPNMVGAHFFQFRDQPLSGRPDGEATLRGFVNVADTPNFELVQTNRRLGYAMYETRAAATRSAAAR